MNHKIYLVCGVAGAGKSWVCNRLSDRIHYNSYDEHGFTQPTKKLELHDRTVGVSTTIKLWRKQGFEVLPIFVMGDFLKIKQQIKDRGGSITKGLYRRWKRMKSLANKYSYFTGDSSEVLKFLKNEIVTSGESPCIYLATFPNKKIYIGQTISFSKRIVHHKWRVNSGTPESKNFFYNAWRKHGEPKFSVIEHIPVKLLYERECFWINHYRSNEKEFGYNLTSGGEGSLNRKLSQATKDKISASNKGKKGPVFSEEVKANLRICAKRRKLTDDSIRRLREGQLGRVHSDSEKHKRSVSCSKPIVRSDGKKYLNMVEAAKDLNTLPQAIMRVLNGTFKQHKGFKFTYLTNPEQIQELKDSRLK